MKRTRYSVEQTPPSATTTGTLLTACRIARRYSHRLPTVAELQEEFGMHRATAYRWLSALKQTQRAA